MILKNILRFSIAFSMLISATLGHATLRSREDALKIATKYVNCQHPVSVSRADSNDDENFAPYYIFNDIDKGHGFVIIRGRDDGNPVLGYSDKGYVEVTNLPSGLRNLLDAIETGVVSTSSGNVSDDAPTPVVEPLITSRWYQYEPYNYKLPVPGMLTGCVATAMAQVINYHNWPEKGHGSGSYESMCPIDKNGSESCGIIDYDLNGSVYDFSKMNDVYLDNNWTQEAADAVATLMRDCGYAVHMQYSKSVSSSFEEDCAEALAVNFGYDTDVFFHSGSQSDADMWLKRLTDELDNGFPVIMNGQRTVFGEDGHCFIADGYDSNGYVHINWGWNGDADGYFDVCSLFPFHNGETLNYSYMQNFISAHPRKPFSEGNYNPYLLMLWDLKDFEHSGVTVENPGVALTPEIPAKIRIDGLMFNSTRSYKGIFQFVLSNAEGKVLKTLASTPIERKALSTENKGQGIKLTSMEIEAEVFKDVADGSYRIIPYSVADGQTPNPVITYGYKQYLTAEVRGGVAVLGNVAAPEVSLRLVESPEIPEEASFYSTIHTTAKIANEGTFVVGGYLHIIMAKEADGEEMLIQAIPVSVYEGYETSVDISVPVLPDYTNTAKLDAGTYKLRVEFITSDNEVVELAGGNTSFTIRITDDPELYPRVKIKSLKVEEIGGQELDISDLRLDLQKDYTITYEYETVGKGYLPDVIRTISYGFDNDGMNGSSYDSPSSGKYSYATDFMFFGPDPGPNHILFRYSDFVTGALIAPEPDNLATVPVLVYDSASGIDSISPDACPVEIARYDVVGRRIQKPTEGINIVVYSDGSVRKEMVGATCE